MKSKPYIMTIRYYGQIVHTPECEHGLPTLVCPKCGPTQEEIDSAPILDAPLDNGKEEG